MRYESKSVVVAAFGKMIHQSLPRRVAETQAWNSDSDTRASTRRRWARKDDDFGWKLVVVDRQIAQQ